MTFANNEKCKTLLQEDLILTEEDLGLTAEDLKEIVLLAKRQNIPPLLAFRKAIALNTRVVQEVNQGGRIIVERENKKLLELLLD